MNKNINKAILCVDDEAIILLSLKQELLATFRGKFIVETAISGYEALEVINNLALHEFKVVLIISDWNMPGMKGDEFLDIVHKKYPTIHFILLSGMIPDNIEQKMFDTLPIRASFSKPWDNNKLIKKISDVLLHNNTGSNEHHILDRPPQQ